MKVGMVPACAQACPTQSIQFGTIADLRRRAKGRLEQLRAQGQADAYIYGDEDVLGGLNSFYLLVDEPEVYGLPRNPRLPTRNLFLGYFWSVVGAALVGILGVLTLRRRRVARDEGARPERRDA
jgi:formate dehydrogenase iron-sulfur subunit